MFPHKGAFSSITSSSNLAPSGVPIIADNQWITQSAYQNVDASTVDWAAVAQQWIHMKESFGTVNNEEHFPIVPPPPRISQPIDYEEQGEAPMEVEHDDEPIHSSCDNSMPLTVPPPPKNAFSSNNWSNNRESSNRQKPNQKHWNNKRGNRWGSINQSKNHRNDSNYVTGQVFNSKQENDTWKSEIVPNANSSGSKFKVMDTNSKSGITQVEQVGLNATPSLDAAQRKTLPAWIREGLEKMEREKMKQADRDREMKERDEKRRQEKLLEQSLLMQFNTNDSAPMLPAKSKFDSESDSDNDEIVNSDYNEIVSKNAKTAQFVSATVGSFAGSSSETTATTIKPHRSKADILTEIMLSVRKNLTEILLEVTNEEIHAIAHETLSKMQTKGRKAQTVQKNVLTAKTSLLGLVTYDDSDGSHSEDESGDDYSTIRQKNNSDADSESELKRTILRRKQSFENKSTEIENYLAKSEERERLWLEKDDENVKANETKNSIELATASTYNLPSKINDSIPLAVPNNKNKTPTNASKMERKGSRFSDAKGLIYNVTSSQTFLSAPIANQYVRPNIVDQKSSTADLKRSESKRNRSDSDSDSSHKRSAKSSRHHSKRYSSRSPSKRKNKHKRRSSTSSSDRSNYSKQSKSSHSSHKYDRYSKEKSRGHKSSRRFSRSRSHSSDRHSKRRHH